MFVKGNFIVAGDLLLGRRIGVEKTLHGLPFDQGFGNDVRGVVHGDPLIEDIHGVDRHQGAAFAKPMATRLFEDRLPVQALFLHLLRDGGRHLLAAVGKAPGSPANRHLDGVLFLPGQDRLAQFFQLFRGS